MYNCEGVRVHTIPIRAVSFVPSPEIDSCKSTASLSAASIIHNSIALCIIPMSQNQPINACMVNEPLSILNIFDFPANINQLKQLRDRTEGETF
jgi:hypothetical protein